MRKHTLMICAAFAAVLARGQGRTATELYVTNKIAAAIAPLADTQSVAEVAGALDIHTNDTANPHGVTAAQIGALTNETDAAALAALAAHAAYWPPNATASSWFTFTTNNGAITITGYNIAGGAAVIIPDYINGWPVTTIGEEAFLESGIVSLIAPQTVTSIGYHAFAGCSLLTSASLPQVTSIGDGVFLYCSSLTSVTTPQARSIGDGAFAFCYSLTAVYMGQNAPAEAAYVFADITPPPTVYVTDQQATGWGDTWNGAPVVRLDLYGDKIYQDGELVATTGHVAQAIAGKVDTDGGTATNLWLQGETIVSDSYTNLWWRNVFSNGWHWLVAYTNAPGGAE